MPENGQPWMPVCTTLYQRVLIPMVVSLLLLVVQPGVVEVTITIYSPSPLRWPPAMSPPSLPTMLFVPTVFRWPWTLYANGSAKATPDKSDLVSYQEYDAFGRESNSCYRQRLLPVQVHLFRCQLWKRGLLLLTLIQRHILRLLMRLRR